MATTLRQARDADSPRVAEIVEACYALYPGCIFALDDEQSELRRIASHYRDLGGELWVAEDEGHILGCVAWKPLSARVLELQRLYVDPAVQGRGLGRRLVAHAIAAAGKNDASAIELWTDTRFDAAHRLYERLGFRRGAMTRSLGDRSRSVEFFYRLTLGNGVSPKREN